MSSSQRVGVKTAALSAPVYRGDARPLARASGSASARQRRAEQQVRASRFAIVFSLFLALIAGALLMGGHSFIEPMLQAAAEQREAHRMGDIVLTTPDGRLCRHLSFDNKTAEITEGSVEQCAEEAPREHAAAARGFSWSTR